MGGQNFERNQVGYGKDTVLVVVGSRIDLLLFLANCRCLAAAALPFAPVIVVQIPVHGQHKRGTEDRSYGRSFCWTPVNGSFEGSQLLSDIRRTISEYDLSTSLNADCRLS
jgi:hypothetical protein